MSTTEETALRPEFVDRAIKAIAARTYKLKNLCTIDSSSAWTESYFRETNTPLTGGTTASIGGVPRLAPFPYVEPIETKVSAIIQKYAAEGMVSEEASLMNYLPMIERTIFKVAQAVTNKMDIDIEAAMSSAAGNTYAITGGNEWDSATVANRKPLYDVLKAGQLIKEDYIDLDALGGYLVVNTTDYANLASNSIFTSSLTYKNSDVVTSGNVPMIGGLEIVQTDSVTADQAYVVAKGSMVWKQVKPLTTETVRNAGISTTIRAWEFGVIQIQVPNGITKITNTRA